MNLINYDFQSLPEQLKRLPQWILWKSETKSNGKVTKIPYQIDGNEARANDYTTWSTFTTANKFYTDSNASGIGFVFSKEDEYIGVDIDGCVEYSIDDIERNKPIINDFARLLIDTLDSYTEFSVSGTGIHIIVKGKLPSSICGTGRKNSKLGLEIYQYGRYFTMTGNRENDNDVEERTDEIEGIINQYFDDTDLKARVVKLEDYSTDKISLSNSELWQKMFSSKSGSQIESMYKGDLVVNDDHSSTDLALCNYLAFWTGKSAHRMDSMFRETGLMRDKWDRIHHTASGETYGERTISMAIASTSSTILDKKDRKEYKDVVLRINMQEKEDENVPFFRLTELGNAERVAFHRGDDIKFVKGGKWQIWNGKKWHQDNGSEVQSVVTDVLKELHESDDEAVQKWAMRCEGMNNIKNTSSLLRSFVQSERNDFDRDKYLFNVQNGIIDLRNGDLLPHDRDKLITKISPMSYDKYALCPNWIRFVDQITLGNNELADYLQRLIGYAMTGDITEQIMIFFVGGGSNGKSTFINIIKEIMGDYGKQTSPNTFIKKKEGAPTNDIARLVGSRFVSAIESEDSEQLSESLVKQITGGEPVLARFLHEEFFEFEPEFKVFFTTNHKPIVKGVDNGIWRRIKLVPFDLQMTDADKDILLPQKLKKEMSGILNWCLEGCLKWQKEGLKEPKIVSESTKEYKDEMDIVQPFIDRFLKRAPENNEIAKDVYQKYINFCYDEGERPLSNRAFYRMLATKGFKKKVGAGNKTYILDVFLKNLETDTEKRVERLTLKLNKNN